MKNKTYFLNTILAAVLFVAMLAVVLLRSLAPMRILPVLNIPNMVALCLVALLLDHYFAPGAKRCYICIPVLSALSFFLLPWAAGYADVAQSLKLALIGMVVFTVTTWLYSSIQERLSSGPACRMAPVLSALGLFLAAQCFAGILL